MVRSIFLSLIFCFSSLVIASNGDKSATSDDLRSMLLNLKPNQIGLNKDNYPYEVFAVAMETGVPTGSYMLSAIADGSTSLYFSNGGGIIGGGEHEKVREASLYLLSGAEHFKNKTKATSSFPKPNDGEVIFYFITFNGVKSYHANEIDLGGKKDELSGLFYAAHNVITELRNTEEK